MVNNNKRILLSDKDISQYFNQKIPKMIFAPICSGMSMWVLKEKPTHDKNIYKQERETKNGK